MTFSLKTGWNVAVGVEKLFVLWSYGKGGGRYNAGRRLSRPVVSADIPNAGPILAEWADDNL
jgi:hypothetical protein